MASVLWCVSVRVFLLYLTLFFKTTFTATQNHPLLFLSIIQTKPVEMRRIGKSFRWYIIWFGGHYQASKKFVFSRFAQCTVGDFLSLMNLSSKACGLVVIVVAQVSILMCFSAFAGELVCFSFLTKNNQLEALTLLVILTTSLVRFLVFIPHFPRIEMLQKLGMSRRNNISRVQTPLLLLLPTQ